MVEEKIRKINRIFQDYMREKRLKFGKWLWDKKENKEIIKEGNFIENNNIKSILFLRYDGKIGDMVINTLMFREIKKRYPNIKIGVVARESNAQIIKNNSNVDNIYIYKKNRKDIIELSKKISIEKYDLLIDFSDMLRVNQMMLINKCKARFNMGLNRENWKLFDISYSFPEGSFHITKLYEKVLNILGLVNVNLDYDLHFSEDEKKKVKELLSKIHDKKLFVLNPFAASKHREINRENIKKIIDIILKKEENVVFIIGEKNRKSEILDIVKLYSDRVKYPELNGIMETAYLIKKSDCIITPDTSIVHIAAAFKKKLIAIYRMDNSNENQVNKELWAPNYEGAKQIFSIDLDVKKGEEPDINKFDINEIKRELKFLEGSNF